MPETQMLPPGAGKRFAEARRFAFGDAAKVGVAEYLRSDERA